MKKLMIAAAIVCAAAISQAAVVTWGGAIADPAYPGIDTAAQKYPATAVLIWSASAFSSVDQLAGLTVGSDAKLAGVKVAEVVDTYAITQEDSDAWGFSQNYSKAGSGVDGYYAVLVTDGDANTMASYYQLAQISGTSEASGSTDRTINADWSGGEFLEQGGYTVAVGAVPEPTSGLLLLLGVAGLALRRRRA